MNVKDIMIQNPILLKPQQSIFSAREIMLIHEYECLFVVDDDRRPIGVVTSIQMSADEKKKSVDKVMKTDVPVLLEEQTVQEAAAFLTSQDRATLALPVVDGSGAVVGVVRIRDIVKDLAAPPSREGALSPEAGVIYSA